MFAISDAAILRLRFLFAILDCHLPSFGYIFSNPMFVAGANTVIDNLCKG